MLSVRADYVLSSLQVGQLPARLEGIKQRLCVLGECALEGYGQIFFPAIGRAGKSARHLDFLPDQCVDTPPQDELGLEL